MNVSSITPKETAAAKTTPNTASMDMFEVARMPAMSRATSIANPSAPRNGLNPNSRPSAMPVRAVCPIASEKNDIFRRTTNTPSIAMSVPTSRPTISSRWKNGKVIKCRKEKSISV